jgi:hypothetical protein
MVLLAIYHNYFSAQRKDNMKLSEIKYKGEKINKATSESTYTLFDHSLNAVLYTGSFRQCWIRREYLAQHENISNFEIMVV